MAVNSFWTEIIIDHKTWCSKEQVLVREFDKILQRNVWRCPECNRKATAVVDESIKREFKN